jgi:hypothetical protein
MNGHLFNELGWSDATVDQRSSFIMWVPTGPGSDPDFIEHRLMYNQEEEREHYWDFNIAEWAEVRQYNFASQSSFTEGEWVLLSAQIFDWNHVWVDDYDSKAEIKNSWIIKSLDVTSIP